MVLCVAVTHSSIQTTFQANLSQKSQSFCVTWLMQDQGCLIDQKDTSCTEPMVLIQETTTMDLACIVVRYSSQTPRNRFHPRLKFLIQESEASSRLWPDPVSVTMQLFGTKFLTLLTRVSSLYINTRTQMNEAGY